MYKNKFLISPVQTGYVVMTATGIAYALLGGLTLWFSFEPLLRFGVGEYHLLLSALFLMASAVGYKKQSRAILAIGLAVSFVDLLLMIRSVYFINGKTYVLPYIVWALTAQLWVKGVRDSH